jgi:hypothetical protein
MNAKRPREPEETLSHTLQIDPPEGSREIIERELARMEKAEAKKKRSSDKAKNRRGR